MDSDIKKIAVGLGVIAFLILLDVIGLLKWVVLVGGLIFLTVVAIAFICCVAHMFGDIALDIWRKYNGKTG